MGPSGAACPYWAAYDQNSNRPRCLKRNRAQFAAHAFKTQPTLKSRSALLQSASASNGPCQSTQSVSLYAAIRARHANAFCNPWLDALPARAASRAFHMVVISYRQLCDHKHGRVDEQTALNLLGHSMGKCAPFAIDRLESC